MFVQKVPFDEAYPTIDDITVEFKENGYMLHPHQKRSGSFSKENLVPSMPCSNVSCKQGGFSLEPVIRNMVRNKQTTLEETVGCKGHEGSPKGRRRGRDCMNHVELKISIKYKENQSHETDENE
jgi:hypothetical protein